MKIISAAALLSFSAVSVQSIELSSENWETETAGKTVFIKFFAPWCGHCKAMKPDWDKLMEEFSGSATQLVAEVDCTDAGEDLCDELGVQGYPSLKWGDPSALEDYEGGRSYDDFKEFADENLKPMCSPSNIDLCDDAKKAEIKKFQSMSDADLAKFISDQEEKAAKVESDFESFVEDLQAKYEAAMEKMQADTTAIKKAGLGLAKAVRATKGKGSDEL